MPQARMSMYLKGVEIYIAPTADSREQWAATMQQIALEGRWMQPIHDQGYVS